MKVTYHIFTDKGSYEINEDSAGVVETPDGCCFAMADGLGGHGSGEVASRIAVETVKKSFEENDEMDADNRLHAVFTDVQDAVMEAQKAESIFNGMKTTLTVLAIYKDCLQWGHIGDSRVYLFRRGKQYARTLDHSVPQMLVASGEIKEKDIRNHPDRNRLLRVIGTEWETPRYQLSRIHTPNKTDSFLLCSDGFWELIEEKTMQQILKHSDTVTEWIENMAEEVRKNGQNRKMDNYTAIGVWIRED